MSTVQLEIQSHRAYWKLYDIPLLIKDLKLDIKA